MDYKEYVKSKQGTFKHRYIYEKNGEKPEKVGVIVDKDGHFGWSFCSEKDTFSKSKGKAVALLRAESGKSCIWDIPLKYCLFLEQIEKKWGELERIEFKEKKE